MAYSIGNITRRNSKQLDIAITDGLSVPLGSDIIFIDSSESSDWSLITQPSDLPNATKYFTEVDEIESTVSLYVIRDIPYRVGSHTLFIKHEGTWYKKLDVELTSEGLSSPFPGILNRATTKQKSAVINNNDLKGGIKVFTSIYDLLMLDKAEMELGMKCTIWLKQENKIKTYALNPNYEIDSIPYPLLDEPYDPQEPRETDARSFRKYWYLDSVAEPELQPVAEVEYAPDFNGGIPPFFEGYINDTTKSDGYTFPNTTRWDEERSFTQSEWTNERVVTGEKRSKWKRLKETTNGNKSRPIRINALKEGYLANRFQRRFEYPKVINNEGILVNFKIRTFYKGEANLIAEYDIDGTEYSFEDIPPERRTWEQIEGEERAKYITYYNNSYSTYTGYSALADGTNVDTLPTITTPDGLELSARALIERDNNKLWVVYAEKDDFTNLESTWTEPQVFIEGNGALVRYSVEEGQGDTDINDIRIQISDLVNSQGGTEADYYYLYEEAGFIDEYDFDTTNYIHTRDEVGQAWISVKVRDESGAYEDIVYKAYPINYYDRLNNTRTKFNYIPVGLNGEKNPQDDIRGNPKDSAFQPQEGYELYFSVAKKLFENKGFITNWSPWIRSSARSAVVDVIEADDTVFKSTIINNQNNSVVERANTINTLEAKLFIEQEEIVEGDVYQKANILEGIEERREEIRYTWKRLFNNGQSENLVILDQSPSRIYYGYKSQAAFDAYFVTGNESPEITPSSNNTGFRIGYKNDANLGFIIYDKTLEANTLLRRISLTTGAEGYKRNGKLYDANDAEIASDIWVTDDLSKLDNQAWVDYIAFEFQGTLDFETQIMSWINKGRATYNRQVTFTENGVEETVTPFTFDTEGKIMSVHHVGVDGKAVFEVTQWRKVIDNPDFVGVDENYIPYRAEITLRDLVDRVKKSISVLPDSSFLLAKPNFTTYTENEFIGKKSITVSRFTENLPDGSWWTWNTDFNFDDAKRGINIFAGISFETVMTDPTYWINLNISTLSYNVVFSQFIDTDNTIITDRTYKYQVVEDGKFFYDFTTLSINFSGESAQDMKLSPEVFVIPLNETADAFDGNTSKTFNVSSENVESPYYEWKLLTKGGATIKTVTGTEVSPQNSLTINFATDTALGADTAARILYIKDNTPFTIQVKDLRVNKASFIEEGTISYIAGGVSALVGEQGVGGINIIYDNNDLVPSNNDGVVGTVNESTSILVYRGIEAQPIGTNSGEFNIILVDARDGNGNLIANVATSLSINSSGVIANVTGSDTIQVTDIPDAKDITNIRFKVREGTTIVKDASNADVIFSYKLKKAKAGSPSWLFDVKNQFFPSVIDGQGNTSPNYNTSTAVFESEYEFLKGITPKDINSNVVSVALQNNDSVKNVSNVLTGTFTYNGTTYTKYQNFQFTGQSGTVNSKIRYTSNKFIIMIALSTIKGSFFNTPSLLLKVNANANGFDNPQLETVVKIAKINEGIVGNDYFLELTSGSGVLSNQNSTVELTLRTVENNSDETIGSFNLDITGNQTGTFSSSTKKITISKNSSVTQPILTVQLSFIVSRNGNNYNRTVYYTVPNILSQRSIIPVYAGRWDEYTETNKNNLMNYLNQGNLTINDGTYKVAYSSISGLADNGGQVRRISNNSLITSSISLIDPSISRAYRNDSGAGAISIQGYNGSVQIISNNVFITYNLNEFPTPLAQSFLIEQEDGTLKLQKWHKILGETGERGRNFRFKTVYIKKGEGTTPSKPNNETVGAAASITGNETSSSGTWSTTVPTPSGGQIIWESTIMLELLADGTYKYAESEWSKPKRLTGWTGSNVVRLFSTVPFTDAQRQSSSVPTGTAFTFDLSTLNNFATVYVTEIYQANGSYISRFNAAGAYSNTGTYFWSKSGIYRKNGSNGNQGRGIDDIKIENNNLKVRYTQSPNSTSYEDLGRVVGNDGVSITVTSSSTAPTSPKLGDIWIDTSA